MLVIKFDDRTEAQWREWLTKPRSTDEIVQKLQGDRFEAVHAWTEERVVNLLFEDFDENYYNYGFGVVAHLPNKFLALCLEFIDNLDEVNDDTLCTMFEEVAEADFKDEIYQYACDCADENEESRPTPDTIAEYIDQYALQWLESIVREAIAAYTSPIAFLISPSNYTE